MDDLWPTSRSTGLAKAGELIRYKASPRSRTRPWPITRCRADDPLHHADPDGGCRNVLVQLQLNGNLCGPSPGEVHAVGHSDKLASGTTGGRDEVGRRIKEAVLGDAAPLVVHP